MQTRSEMAIKTEAELVLELAKGLQAEFETDVAIREFSAGYGIADLVFAQSFKRDNKLGRLPVNNYYAVQLLLLSIEKDAFTSSDVRRITGTSVEATRLVLRTLLEGEYIQKLNSKQYVKLKGLDNPIKKIVAIEAKLRDWRSGIMQARRYKSFTDECYLAILADYEKNIDYDFLDQFGVGLIVFNQESGDIEFKRRPKENQFLAFYEDAMGVFAKEHFLHRLTDTKTSLRFVSN